MKKPVKKKMMKQPPDTMKDGAKVDGAKKMPDKKGMK